MMASNSIYEIKINSINGSEINLNDFKGKKILFVNVASECGFTSQYEGLQKLPKNSAAVRMHNRCKLTGRPKGYMRQFGISRVTFREMASSGLIPGVKKASW